MVAYVRYLGNVGRCSQYGTINRASGAERMKYSNRVAVFAVHRGGAPAYQAGCTTVDTACPLGTKYRLS